jgi:SecD/SecF fusion protein
MQKVMPAVWNRAYLGFHNGTRKCTCGAYSLKQCREMEISLGLDLKGGMNVILEVSVPDVIKTLANNNADPTFNKALKMAATEAATSQSDIVSLFVKSYRQLAPECFVGTSFRYSTVERQSYIAIF